MEKQVVRFATLHEVIGVPTEPKGDMVNLKSTLDPKSPDGVRTGLKMWVEGTCIAVQVNKTVALVPMTNFKVIVLEKQPEEAKA